MIIGIIGLLLILLGVVGGNYFYFIGASFIAMQAVISLTQYSRRISATGIRFQARHDLLALVA